MKKPSLILLCVCAFTVLSTRAFAQSSTSIVLDASSLTPVNTDAVTGLAIDPIGRDRSNRECARIKLHINRMTPEEISQIEVRPTSGIIDVRTCVPNYNGTGLIIELTAKPKTSFYLYHRKYGDSNEVTVHLEGNREYTMKAWNETKLSIVVTFPESGAEVYLDEAFRGFVENNHLTISDLTLGHHDLSFRYSAGDYSENIYISPASIFFEIDPEKKDQGVQEIAEPEVPEHEESNGLPDDFLVLRENNLSEIGTANCYIVSESGVYSFPVVKGNSYEPVGDVSSAEVLWESFGTSETPAVGSLIASVSVDSDAIVFEVPEPYREGNAVIAAKDASGTILWSWHIWLTDQPQGQVYNNEAGTMMDRNLGATSAVPGNVGALGLLYQWGRKDPFLGSSSISSATEAKSTLIWPSAVSSSSSTGTVDYITTHPTTYVIGDSSTDYDWHYSSRDDSLWQSSKTIYDPCPSGWRVPDGGYDGVWSTTKDSFSFYNRSYDNRNEGMNFAGDFSRSSAIWYPASGFRYYDDGVLYNVGYYGYYWSVTPYGNYSYRLYFNYDGNVNPTSSSNRADGFSVRCVQVIDEVAEL